LNISAITAKARKVKLTGVTYSSYLEQDQLNILKRDESTLSLPIWITEFEHYINREKHVETEFEHLN